MPIRPETKHLYPPRKEWLVLRAERLEAQGNACAWCGAPNREWVYRQGDKWSSEYHITGKGANPWRYVRVILTVAHLNHDPTDNRPENTPALCQLCHNRHDAKHRAEGRKARKGNK